MDLNSVLTLLDGELITDEPDLSQVVVGGGAADLMSDVLAYAEPDLLLLTGLVNPQAVRAAEMAGIRAILFVRGKRPPAETVAIAQEIGLPLLRTRYTMYEACGRLYAAGLPGLGLCDDYEAEEQSDA